MITINDLQIDLAYWGKEDENRLKTLKLVLAGYSNNCIAQELNFSLKNIESIIAKLFRRCSIITRGDFSYLINPRAKLLAGGICKEWLRYTVEERPRNRELLSRNQYLTLVLGAAGCSNKAIAEFLCISSKTVESRLNSLFNQFTVNSQSEKQVNPRIRLIVTGLKQRVLSTTAIQTASEILNPEDWENIVKNREQIKETFLRMQFEQSKPYMIQPDSSLEELANKLTNGYKPVYNYGQQNEQNIIQPQQFSLSQGAGSQNWG